MALCLMNKIMSLLLSPTEIQELTDRQRPGWQARCLKHLGIPFRRRPDGSLVVLRCHVEDRPQTRPAPEPQLRFD